VERPLIVKHAAVDGRGRLGTIGETCEEFLKVVKPSAYVSIAEALQVALLTADQRLASAPGPRPNIEVPSPIHRTGAGVHSPHFTGAKTLGSHRG
jgi:hypothetical protein